MDPNIAPLKCPDCKKIAGQNDPVLAISFPMTEEGIIAVASCRKCGRIFSVIPNPLYCGPKK